METKEVLERWEFKVEYEEGEDQGEGSKENVNSNVTSQKAAAAPMTSEKGYRNVSNKVSNKKIHPCLPNPPIQGSISQN